MATIVEFKEVSLDDLVIGKAQVRLSDTGADIDELADSIAKQGLLEPILIAPAETPGKYQIILGQRRFLAHRKLNLPTIRAGILSEAVDEIQAKVLSLTENLVRRDLNRKDMIDVCTALYKKYSSMRDVERETGLPYEKVREYVKYDRLIPELKTLVDDGGVDLKAALRAQDAVALAPLGNNEDAAEAVKLAKAMSTMSGAQQKKIKEELQHDSSISIDEVVELAKSGGKITQIVVTLGDRAHGSLNTFARDEGFNIDEAAATLIENALTTKGYLSEEP